MPFSAFDIGDGDLRIGELSEEVGAHFSIWPIGYISPTDKNINAEMPFQPTRRTENYHEDDVYTNFSRLQSVYFYALNYPDKSDSEIAPWPKVFSSVYPENYYEGFADPVRRARD